MPDLGVRSGLVPAIRRNLSHRPLSKKTAKARPGELPEEPAEAIDLEEPAMRGVGGEPREVVVRVPEALSLSGEVFSLFSTDLTVELDDGRPLLKGLDIGRENRSRMPRHGDVSASES